MAGQYAKRTEVSADRSRAEIEKTLVKYGATGFVTGWAGVAGTQSEGNAVGRYRAGKPVIRRARQRAAVHRYRADRVGRRVARGSRRGG